MATGTRSSAADSVKAAVGRPGHQQLMAGGECGIGGRRLARCPTSAQVAERRHGRRAPGHRCRHPAARPASTAPRRGPAEAWSPAGEVRAPPVAMLTANRSAGRIMPGSLLHADPVAADPGRVIVYTFPEVKQRTNDERSERQNRRHRYSGAGAGSGGVVRPRGGSSCTAGAGRNGQRDPQAGAVVRRAPASRRAAWPRPRPGSARDRCPGVERCASRRTKRCLARSRSSAGMPGPGVGRRSPTGPAGRWW